MVRNDFYVYVFFRETGIPFYVGKGRGNRWLQHETLADKKSSHKNNIIRKMQLLGFEIPKVKVAENLPNDVACVIEIALIAALGRYPNGPLVNMTRGGDGLVDPSPELRARFSAAHKGRKMPPRSEKWRAARRLSQLGKFLPQETKDKIRAALKGRPITEQAKRKMSVTRKGKKTYTPSQEIKDKIRSSLKNRSLSEETKMKMSTTRKAMYAAGLIPHRNGRFASPATT